MQFATPPKMTLSHWLLFLGYVPFLELRLVLKLSIVLSCARKCIKQAISLILLYHNFLLCFEVLHSQTIASIVHHVTQSCNQFWVEEDRHTPAILAWRQQEISQSVSLLRATPCPPCPQEFFKIMQFSSNFKGKPLFWTNFGLRAPLGVKTLLGLPPDQNPGSAPSHVSLDQSP